MKFKARKNQRYFNLAIQRLHAHPEKSAKQLLGFLDFEVIPCCSMQKKEWQELKTAVINYVDEFNKQLKLFETL